MKLMKISLLVALALSFATSAMAEKKPTILHLADGTEINVTEGRRLLLSFPINPAEKQFIIVEPPEGFKLGYSDVQTIKPDGHVGMYEFVPTHEKIEDWSVLWTYHTFVGVGARQQAKLLAEVFYSQFKQNGGVEDLSEPDYEEIEGTGHKDATLTFSYIKNGVKETLLYRVFAGPNDYASAKMTYRTDPDTEKEVADSPIYQKMKEAFLKSTTFSDKDIEKGFKFL